MPNTDPAPAARIDELDTPAVLVDLEALERNLAEMAARAARAGVRLRPHAKTHKTTWIAREQIRHGAAGLTLAKLGEAEVMADAGIDDILVAYPIVGEAKLARLRQLATRVRVIVALDDVATAANLAAVGRSLPRPLEVYVEVDSGLHRCGRPPGSESAELAERVARLPGLRLLGLMTHAGHASRVPDVEGRRAVALEEARALVETAALLADRGIEVEELSVGSTPTAAHVAEVRATYPRITEIRPGTYVFYDANQVALGTASVADCALRVLVTIVSRPAPDRAVADAGTKTLAADLGIAGGFGLVRGHPEVRVEALTEEHAVIRIPPETPGRIGDRIEIVPNHACIVPSLADRLIGIRGDRVERAIPVEARGRNR